MDSPYFAPGLIVVGIVLLLAVNACMSQKSPFQEEVTKINQEENQKRQQADTEPFQVKFETSAGDFTVEVNPSWAPLGAARFRELIEADYYNGCRFFRVIAGFMAQFGIHGDPEISAQWQNKRIKDDPVVESNQPGMISFAMAGPNTRTTQLFINLVNNARLDRMGFAPFAKVIDGMEVVQKIHSDYGGGPGEGGRGPEQHRIVQEGNAYLEEDFPKLDYVIKTSIQ